MPAAWGRSSACANWNICTGCGPGAMEAPTESAAVGHAQQRYKEGRFIGMTEPSIIAAEPPPPSVPKTFFHAENHILRWSFSRSPHPLPASVRRRSGAISSHPPHSSLQKPGPPPPPPPPNPPPSTHMPDYFMLLGSAPLLPSLTMPQKWPVR